MITTGALLTPYTKLVYVAAKGRLPVLSTSALYSSRARSAIRLRTYAVKISRPLSCIRHKSALEHMNKQVNVCDLEKPC